MSARLRFAVVACAITLAAAGQRPAAAAADEASERFARLAVGRFDNHQQVAEATEAAAAPRPARVHLAVTRVEARALGPTVLSAWRSEQAEAGVKVGHLVFRVSVGAGGAVRVDAFEPQTPLPATAEPPGAEALAAAVAKGVRAIAGCTVTWQADGDGFSAAPIPAGCGADWAAAAWRLSAEGWSVTPLAGAGGSPPVEAPPTRLLRARAFECWTVLRREGTTDQYDVARGLRAHDQGQRLPMGPDARYSFDLAQLRYSGSLPVLRLALFERGQDRALAYTWGEAGATRLGLNLRWVQVGCAIAPEGQP